MYGMITVDSATPAPTGGRYGRGEVTLRIVEILDRQAQLLEIVRALGAAGRFGAACTAGSKRPIKMPMMAITTSSSTKVNPFTFLLYVPRIFLISLVECFGFELL